MPTNDSPPALFGDAVARRRFHIAVIYGLWSLIGLTIAVCSSIYLFFVPRTRKDQEWVEAADLAQIEIGSPKEIIFRRNRVDGWKVSSEKASAWVVKKSEAEVIAFAPQCTHLGCAYHWDENRKTFLCPCHTSNFDINGNVIDGPAPRPLDRYLVRIEGGKLLLGNIIASKQA